jgi:hypothetical protein
MFMSDSFLSGAFRMPDDNPPANGGCRPEDTQLLDMIWKRYAAGCRWCGPARLGVRFDNHWTLLMGFNIVQYEYSTSHENSKAFALT